MSVPRPIDTHARAAEVAQQLTCSQTMTGMDVEIIRRAIARGVDNGYARGWRKATEAKSHDG